MQLCKGYKVSIPFRSAGGYFAKGRILTVEEFNNDMVLRLGKVKVSEGYLIPLYEDSEELKKNPKSKKSQSKINLTKAGE